MIDPRKIYVPQDGQYLVITPSMRWVPPPSDREIDERVRANGGIPSVADFPVDGPQGRYEIDTNEVGDAFYQLHGDDHPTLFKTLRNARNAARFDSILTDKVKSRMIPRPTGLIFVFEPWRLRVVADDVKETPKTQEARAAARHLINDLTPIEFAERQVQLWAEHVQRLKKSDPTP